MSLYSVYGPFAYANEVIDDRILSVLVTMKGKEFGYPPDRANEVGLMFPAYLDNGKPCVKTLEEMVCEWGMVRGLVGRDGKDGYNFYHLTDEGREIAAALIGVAKLIRCPVLKEYQDESNHYRGQGRTDAAGSTEAGRVRVEGPMAGADG